MFLRQSQRMVKGIHDQSTRQQEIGDFPVGRLGFHELISPADNAILRIKMNGLWLPHDNGRQRQEGHAPLPFPFEERNG